MIDLEFWQVLTASYYVGFLIAFFVKGPKSYTIKELLLNTWFWPYVVVRNNYYDVFAPDKDVERKKSGQII